jgi:hypothetical protein
MVEIYGITYDGDIGIIGLGVRRRLLRGIHECHASDFAGGGAAVA